MLRDAVGSPGVPHKAVSRGTAMQGWLQPWLWARRKEQTRL